ncbi:PAMP-induced secreted peptide 2-like [Lycium ferocissimum]|uniref:PAMP-induced secreted peptide 2-like n=1 Tax=Lycium ferocissimum TaxID=112874 RepID=UPI0028153D01|nr:PAMP-induced secreted peptide 2-like [Lycium ferocissimum]
MARFLNFVLLLLLITSINFLTCEARPLNILKINDSGSGNVATFDWLTLGFIKDEPSPDVGHKFTNRVQTLGGIKDSGPSPGAGHKVVTSNHQ